MSTLAEWQALLGVQAGASATLTGLVFVAVSIILNRILSVPGLSGAPRNRSSCFSRYFSSARRH